MDLNRLLNPDEDSQQVIGRTLSASSSSYGTQAPDNRHAEWSESPGFSQLGSTQVSSNPYTTTASTSTIRNTAERTVDRVPTGSHAYEHSHQRRAARWVVASADTQMYTVLDARARPRAEQGTETGGPARQVEPVPAGHYVAMTGANAQSPVPRPAISQRWPGVMPALTVEAPPKLRNSASMLSAVVQRFVQSSATSHQWPDGMGRIDGPEHTPLRPVPTPALSGMERAVVAPSMSHDVSVSTGLAQHPMQRPITRHRGTNGRRRLSDQISATSTLMAVVRPPEPSPAPEVRKPRAPIVEWTLAEDQVILDFCASARLTNPDLSYKQFAEELQKKVPRHTKHALQCYLAKRHRGQLVALGYEDHTHNHQIRASRTSQSERASMSVSESQQEESGSERVLWATAEDTNYEGQYWNEEPIYSASTSIEAEDGGPEAVPCATFDVISGEGSNWEEEAIGSAGTSIKQEEHSPEAFAWPTFVDTMEEAKYPEDEEICSAPGIIIKESVPEEMDWETGEDATRAEGPVYEYEDMTVAEEQDGYYSDGLEGLKAH